MGEERRIRQPITGEEAIVRHSTFKETVEETGGSHRPLRRRTTKPDAGDDLVERLREEHMANPDAYLRALERHVAEGVRINLGLQREIEQLRRRGATD